MDMMEKYVMRDQRYSFQVSACMESLLGLKTCMFKTNSNSDHTLKMTAQVAQINAFVGRKNPWDGEKR